MEVYKVEDVREYCISSEKIRIVLILSEINNPKKRIRIGSEEIPEKYYRPNNNKDYLTLVAGDLVEVEINKYSYCRKTHFINLI